MGSYTPAFLRVSAAMATVEFTGLEMMHTIALGHDLGRQWGEEKVVLGNGSGELLDNTSVDVEQVVAGHA